MASGSKILWELRVPYVSSPPEVKKSVPWKISRGILQFGWLCVTCGCLCVTCEACDLEFTTSLVCLLTAFGQFLLQFWLLWVEVWSSLFVSVRAISLCAISGVHQLLVQIAFRSGVCLWSNNLKYRIWIHEERVSLHMFWILGKVLDSLEGKRIFIFEKLMSRGSRKMVKFRWQSSEISPGNYPQASCVSSAWLFFLMKCQSGVTNCYSGVPDCNIHPHPG